MSAKEIPITQFKAKCLGLLDQVAKSGQPLVITKRGKPLAKVTKAVADKRPLMGRMAGTAVEVGDIVYFDTSEDWECLR
jgi:prevent-host-death family protein